MREKDVVTVQLKIFYVKIKVFNTTYFYTKLHRLGGRERQS